MTWWRKNAFAAYEGFQFSICNLPRFPARQSGLFFEPFIFEKMPAVEHSVSKVYLDEVERCSIYIGLFGRIYGYEDTEGVSPTEREFDYASQLYKTRLIFITNHI